MTPKPLSACPNPECEPADYTDDDDFGVFYQQMIDAKLWHVQCVCGYQGPEASNEAEAIRLHNLIAGRSPPAPGLVLGTDSELAVRRAAKAAGMEISNFANESVSHQQAANIIAGYFIGFAPLAAAPSHEGEIEPAA